MVESGAEILRLLGCPIQLPVFSGLPEQMAFVLVLWLLRPNIGESSTLRQLWFNAQNHKLRNINLMFPRLYKILMHRRREPSSIMGLDRSRRNIPGMSLNIRGREGESPMGNRRGNSRCQESWRTTLNSNSRLGFTNFRRQLDNRDGSINDGISHSFPDTL